MTAPPRRHNPYPGLRPFRSDEEHLFFGRENQVDSMIDKLAARRFLAVVGTSGSGKSSLVNCGLRPALHRGLMASAGSRWKIVQFRPGADPMRACAEALAEPGGLFGAIEQPGMPLAQIAEATLRMSSLGLVDLCEQAQLDAETRVLVVVDQFEELFRYRQAGGAASDAVAFVKLLLEARAPADGRIHVVLTMRSDFLGECSQFAGLPEAINEGQYLVPRMTREETRSAIVGPVRVAGAEISPLLVTRLLNDVGDNPDQLSILQHALNRTWAHWQNEGGEAGELDLPHYEAIGTMASALDRHAEKAYDELDERQQRLAEKAFKALTDRGTDARGVRRPTRLAALAEIAGASQAELLDVLAVFRKPSRSFLMPPAAEPATGETVIDISHESLMRVWSRLAEWTAEEATSARTYRRLADAAALHEAGEASLWRDPELRMALDWHRRDQPTKAWALQYHPGWDAAMRFLAASRAKEARTLAEAEVERRWDKYGQPATILLVLVPFVVLHELWFRTLMGWIAGGELSGSDALSVPLRAFGIAVFMTPFLLLFWGLTYYGKAAWCRYALPRLLRSATLGADAEFEPEVARKRGGPDAVTALGTDYASTWRRIGAYAIDFTVQLFIFGFTGGLLGAAIPALFAGTRSEEEINTLIGGFALGLWSVVNWLYNAISVGSGKQATPGMLLAGIFITDLYGDRVSFWRATGWHFAKVLSYYTALIGFLVQPFSKRRQTLHDRVAGTVVLRRAKGP